MSLHKTLLASALVLFSFPLLAEAPNKLTPKEKSAGWHLLFDGKDTAGWRSTESPSFPATGWEAKDGMLSVTDHAGEAGHGGGDIITDRKYTNFELSVDFRVTPGANSGIKYFIKEDPRPGHEGRISNVGFEYQVLDDQLNPDAKNGRNGNRKTASLYDILPPKTDKATRPVGEWNTARIVVRGTHGEHWLNGVKVLEYDRNSPEFREALAQSKFHGDPHFGQATSGYILLQDHGFPVSFRNLKIRELPAGN